MLLRLCFKTTPMPFMLRSLGLATSTLRTVACPTSCPLPLLEDYTLNVKVCNVGSDRRHP